MNISGHENEGAAHMSDEEARVEASLQSPIPKPATPEPESGPRSRDALIVDALSRKDRDSAAGLLVQEHARAVG